jgi:hypothetical protein
MLFRGVVVQVLPEPSLDFSYAQAPAFAVLADLVAVNLSERKCFTLQAGQPGIVRSKAMRGYALDR